MCTTLLNSSGTGSTVRRQLPPRARFGHHGQRAFKMVVDKDHVFVQQSVDKANRNGILGIFVRRRPPPNVVGPFGTSGLLTTMVAWSQQAARSAEEGCVNPRYGVQIHNRVFRSPSGPTNLSKDAFKHRLKPDFVERFNANGHGVSAVRMHRHSGDH